MSLRERDFRNAQEAIYSRRRIRSVHEDRRIDMPQQLKRVMISSTARDLPQHRDKVMHACMRLGMFYPEMMENLTAADANALEVSLKMVDSADIYVGVFAFRYGYVPDGQTISV